MPAIPRGRTSSKIEDFFRDDNDVVLSDRYVLFQPAVLHNFLHIDYDRDVTLVRGFAKHLNLAELAN